MLRCSFVILGAFALVSLGGCVHSHGAARSPEVIASAKAGIIPGPVATQKLFDELAEQDRNLFDAVFNRCDADLVATMLDDDFEFYHDKFGQIASSPQQFVENIRQGCEAQARGTNVKARRELVEGTLEVYPLDKYGAIQTGTHRFFGLEPGKPDHLRETGKFFNVWKQVDGRWKLARVFSYDHHPAK